MPHLRAALEANLSLLTASPVPAPPASPPHQPCQQILIQLRKFNEQVLKTKAGSGPASPPQFASSSSSSSARSGSKASGKGILGRDMSDVLSTDAESIDASIGGIIKRVIVLLLALCGLGTALFYLGLPYLSS